jgi:hypothetical protein
MTGLYVKRQKLTEQRLNVGQPPKKTLGIRYAEVLRLRQAILEAQADSKRRQIDRRASE